jgi:hypothetical protein
MSSHDDQFASALASIRQVLAEDKNGVQRVVGILRDQFDDYSWVGVCWRRPLI